MPQLTDIEIAKAYAEEHGITVSEQDVDKQIETLKDQVFQQAQSQGQDLGREEAFDQALQQAGITEEQLRQQIREQLAAHGCRFVAERAHDDVRGHDREHACLDRRTGTAKNEADEALGPSRRGARGRERIYRSVTVLARKRTGARLWRHRQTRPRLPECAWQPM